MSSRLRYAIKFRGAWYCGGTALRMLKEASGLAVTGIAAIKAAAQATGTPLWIFREPKGINYKQSRYKKLCNYCGMGHRKQKPKAQVAPKGFFYNGPPIQYGVHQPAGQARIPYGVGGH